MTTEPRNQNPDPDRSIPGSNVPPTAREYAVHEELFWGHTGWQNALPLATLMTRVRCGEREVKRAIAGLRLRHGISIGASRQPPEGYFLVRTPEDEEHGLSAYRQQLIAEARTVRIIMRKDQRRFQQFWGQLLLDIEKEDAAA